MDSNKQLQKPKKTKNASPKQLGPYPKPLARDTHPAAIIQGARADPRSLTQTDVLQLQRTIGNRAVGQLMSEIGRIPSYPAQQEPVQRQGLEEEELLQGKFTGECIQCQTPEEEELMQGKFTGECIQCQAPEEEELMQGKFEAIQRQGLEEEEELLQGKFTSDCIQCQAPEEEELMQGKFASGLTGTLQAKEEAPPNRTGMPDHLKAGIETLSGTAMDDVKVHYNSAKPAHVQALAYTQGTDIHVGPGQDKHLPHEAWHVVQQKQGRVKPTMQAKGVAINDDAGLEREADVMGAKSLKTNSFPAKIVQKKYNKDTVAQLEPNGDGYSTEQQELLNLSDELQKNKSQITSVSESEVEEAISVLKQTVQSGDKSTISEVLKKIKSVAKNAETNESESGTVQLAPPWTYKKKRAVKGALIGTLFPVIGTLIGAIIGYKTGKKKDQINQLYTDGAIRAEVTAMMAIEPNAQTLHNQIQAEATQTATLIHQLYITDGATSAEITAMLAVQPNAQTIHNYMQTVVPGFTLGDILFASMAGGNVGSIYFTNGRIRLTHGNNPQVSVHVGITRHTISNPDYGQYRTWLINGRPGGGTKANYIRGLPSFALAVAGVGERLVEFWPGHQHISRGGPVAFNYGLTQTQLNIIGNAANTGSNATLRAWMGAIPALAAIPIN